MVENAVAHLQTNAIVLTVNAFVRNMKHEMFLDIALKSVVFWISDFTCAVDADCNQGYCEDQKCVCLDDNAYKHDCSIPGCEYDI